MAESEGLSEADILSSFEEARIVYNVLAQAAILDLGNPDELMAAIAEVNFQRTRAGETFEIKAPQNTYTAKQNHYSWVEIIAATKNLRER